MRIEGVDHLQILRRGGGGPLEPAESFPWLAGPLEDLTLEGQQVAVLGRHGQSLVDGEARLFALLLAQGGNGEVGLSERLARRQANQLAKDLLGFARPLVLQLRDPTVAQLKRFVGQRGAGHHQGDEQEEREGRSTHV